MPPLGKRPRKWPSQGSPAAVGERYLTAGLGWPLGRTGPTAKAFAFLCVDSTQRSETGQVRGLCGTTDQGNGKGRSGERPMGTAAYGGKGQGKGKGRGEGQLGRGGRGRSKGGEKPMGTTAYGGKGSKGRAANGDRPVGAASRRRDHHTMASCQNPPPLGFAINNETPAQGPCCTTLYAVRNALRLPTYPPWDGGGGSFQVGVDYVST